MSGHDCQRHSAGVFTDPDSYLVAFGAFLDGLPPVSRRRLEEVGLFHDGRLIEADAATGDVDAMTAAGFQRWLRASLAKFIFKSRRLGRAGRAPASRGRAGGTPARTDRAQNRAMRDWAKNKGLRRQVRPTGGGSYMSAVPTRLSTHVTKRPRASRSHIG